MTETPNLADAITGAPDIGHLLVWGQGLIQHADSARLDAQLLLAHVLRRPRSYLTAHPELQPAAAAVRLYAELIERRARGEPQAYLTGTREFWSLSLAVTPDVLVPRPETELTVERGLALYGQEEVRVLDLGTGSGAIALALASERPAWRITATDRSAPALQVARGNAARLGLTRVLFLQGDWFDALASARGLGADAQFDLIVSNPPYVAADDPHLDSLRFEPALALTPGPTGMEALETLVRDASRYLLPGGWLLFEHGTEQGPKLARALVARGYARVRCYADLAGHDRVTEAQWPAHLRKEHSHGSI